MFNARFRRLYVGQRPVQKENRRSEIAVYKVPVKNIG